MNNDLSKRLLNKASKSTGAYKVAAMGFDKNNNFIGLTFNKHRFMGKGGSLHAEMLLMARYGKNLKKIYICRTNKSGGILPIHPCSVCKRKADDLGIKIITTCG